MKYAVRASMLAVHLLLVSAHAANVGRRASLVVHDVMDNSLEGQQASRSETWLLSGLGRLNPVDCFFTLIGGLILGCCGTAYILSWWQRRVRSELLLGPDTHRTVATITNLQHFITGDESKTHHFQASYTFEAVRLDGMRCLMTVEPQRQMQEIGNREQPAIAWQAMSVGSKVQVIYLKSDPRYCRLDKANEEDYEQTHSNLCVGCSSFWTVVFIVCMIIVDLVVVKCFMRKWQNGHLVAALIFGASSVAFVVICTPSVVPGLRPIDVAEEELGYQKKAESLGDISGTWLFRSALGTFEYEFVMATETTVTTRGRQQGSSDWDPECEGHFVGEDGTELIWDDFEGSHMRVKFDSQGGLAGSISTDVGEQVDFAGARPATA